MGHSPGQRIPNDRAASLRHLHAPGGRGEHRGALRVPHPLALAPGPRRRAAARAAHRAHRPGSLDRPALRGARLLRRQERGRGAGGHRRLRGGAGGGARGRCARARLRGRGAPRARRHQGGGPAQTARWIFTACAFWREIPRSRRCTVWWIRCSRRRRKASTSHPGERSGAMVAPSLRPRRGPSGTVGAAPRRRMRPSSATVQAPAPPASPSGDAARIRADRASRRSGERYGLR